MNGGKNNYYFVFKAGEIFYFSFALYPDVQYKYGFRFYKERVGVDLKHTRFPEAVNE